MCIFFKKELMCKLIMPKISTKNKKCCSWFFNISVDGEGNAGGSATQLLDLTRYCKYNIEQCWNSEFFQEMRNRFLKKTIHWFNLVHGVIIIAPIIMIFLLLQIYLN